MAILVYFLNCNNSFNTPVFLQPEYRASSVLKVILIITISPLHHRVFFGLLPRNVNALCEVLTAPRTVKALHQMMYVPRNKLKAPHQMMYVPRNKLKALHQMMYVPRNKLKAPHHMMYLPRNKLKAAHQIRSTHLWQLWRSIQMHD